jgi:CDP-paratose 2-epimerase
MRVVVTGGAGFIGCNTVRRLLQDGHEVVVYDNLSRKGTRSNLEWLRTIGEFEFWEADLRDFDRCLECLRSGRTVDVVIHLAGQVAVTTSVLDPREDFEINAVGSFNVLEAARESGRDPIVIYASTNKVYGGMEDIAIVEEETRYRYRDLPHGIPESRYLDFHSPYGCSKGAADQYFRDYQRIYGLRTVTFRQCAIYGPRQFGIEDQGWVAWFVIAALMGRPITIYGDGKQVRDVLWVDDLVEAYLRAVDRIDSVAGGIFNIGGGPDNALSVWVEFGPLLEELLGRKIPVAHADWRPGDQPCFVSDIRKAREELGWEPRVTAREGVERLFEWIRDNLELVKQELGN